VAKFPLETLGCGIEAFWEPYWISHLVMLLLESNTIYTRYKHSQIIGMVTSAQEPRVRQQWQTMFTDCQSVI